MTAVVGAREALGADIEALGKRARRARLETVPAASFERRP